MADIDTSAEAVERLALNLEGIARQTTTHNSRDRATAKDAATTLRALTAERDEALATARAAIKAASDETPARCNIEVERDAARAEAARLREALTRWQHYGCPDCGGDCSAANPPVACCIMRETSAALAREGREDGT